MKSRRQMIFRAVLVLLLALAAFAAYRWFSGRSPAPAAPQQALTQATATEPDQLRYPPGAAQLNMLRIVTVRQGPLPLTGSLSARLTYDEDVTARISVSFAGRIVALRAAPGDTVKAGQVLAEIDSPDYGTARADLDKALADLQLKQLAAARGRELGPGDGIARKEVEALEADQAQAAAEVERARQRIRNMNPRNLPIEGQRLKLVSPMDGVVTERTASPALEVAPGMAAPLFVVTNPRRLWLVIDLPERLSPYVKRGGLVSVESDAYPDRYFSARVAQLGQAVDPNTRRVPIRAELDNTGRELLPEMFVRALLLQEDGVGIRVPNEALVNRGVQHFVFVQESPGVFRRRPVTLLTQGSDASYLREGLRDGETIVTAGALLLDAELTARIVEKQ
jgi:cobalt-zinc-cadmium efflux system membrane fusion protein